MTTSTPERSGPSNVWVSKDVASGWQSGAAARGQTLGPATEQMLDLAGVRSCHRVLDVGAGTGEQTLLAAQRVGPGGVVLATDISPSMLDRAREAAHAANLLNVQTRVMDAQHLELESGSFDAAIARLSLQFVPDPERALAEVRRVLKPGGRFAVMVISTTEKNPYRAIPQAIASRLAGRQFPEPGPGQWALNNPAALSDVYRRAGFREVEVRPVIVAWCFPSVADARRNSEESQPPLMKLLAELSERDRAAAWSEIDRVLQAFTGRDGFQAPGEFLIAVGTS